jgi:hypothetical protein
MSYHTYHFCYSLTRPHSKLKPSARPVELPDHPYRLVSGADFRLMAFESVNEATRRWITGREFIIARLLGDAYKGQAERYAGGLWRSSFPLTRRRYDRTHDVYLGRILHCERKSRHPSIVFALSQEFDRSPKPSARLSMSMAKTSARSSPLTAPPLGASWPYVSVQ